jgi:glycosyltransferase involved in cell wall biosynthesis
MARVCMVAFNIYLHDARTRRQAEALVARGDEVDCICLRKKEHRNPRVVNGVRLFPYTIDKYRGTNLGFHLTQHFFFFCFAFFMVLRQQLRKRYDVVHVHTLPDYLVFVAAAAKILGTKIVLDVHELMPELYVSKFGAREGDWIVRLLTWVEKRSIAFADTAIAVHDPHLDALVRHGNSRETFIVQLNVPDSSFCMSRAAPRHRESEKFRLVYHGLIAERTGFSVVLRAVALARVAIPNLEFQMIGAGDGLAAAMELAKQLRLDGCVRFVNDVPNEDIPALIGQADVGVIPYPADQFTRYMLPAKLLEYVAMGIPVIASRLETISYYFAPNMLRYVEPGSEADLAAQIIDLYHNPKQRRELATNAMRFSAKYNWENQKREYLDLIDSMVSANVSTVRRHLRKAVVRQRSGTL